MMRKAWSFLLCLCMLMSVPCGGFAEDFGLDEYRAVAATLFGMPDGLHGLNGEAVDEASLDEAGEQYRRMLAQVPASSMDLFAPALGAVSDLAGEWVPIPGGVPAAVRSEGEAVSVEEAMEAYRSVLAGIPDAPAPLLGHQALSPLSDKEIAVLGTKIYLTLPSDAYLYSSDTDKEYWTSPTLGILIAFARMEYYPLSTWESVLEKDGCTIFTGSIGNVSLVSGQKHVENSGYQLSYIYEYGGDSYMISAVGMAYDQALAFIDVMRSLRSGAYATPSPSPTPGMLSKAEKILDTRAQMMLPLDMNRYSVLENGEIWQCLSSGLMMGFFKANYAGYSAWKDVMEADGCEVSLGYIHDVFVVLGKKYIENKGHQLTCYFNFEQASYCIMGTSMTDAQLKQMQDIVDTMEMTSASAATPAPSVALKQPYRILNTRVTVNLPQDAYLYSDQDGSEYWYSPKNQLLLCFSRYDMRALDAWKSALASSGYKTGEYEYGGISVIVGDLYVEDEGYARTYVFNYEGFSYVVVGAQLSSEQMHLMLEIIRTLHMGAAEPVLDLPDDLLVIGEQSFAACGAVVVVVPEGCTAIGSRAFADSKELIKIVIPSSVTDIASDAFDGCDRVAIYAPAGSDAIAYAKEAGIPYFEQETDD